MAAKDSKRENGPESGAKQPQDGAEPALVSAAETYDLAGTALDPILEQEFAGLAASRALLPCETVWAGQDAEQDAYVITTLAADANNRVEYFTRARVLDRRRFDPVFVGLAIEADEIHFDVVASEARQRIADSGMAYQPSTVDFNFDYRVAPERFRQTEALVHSVMADMREEKVLTGYQPTFQVDLEFGELEDLARGRIQEALPDRDELSAAIAAIEVDASRYVNNAGISLDRTASLRVA